MGAHGVILPLYRWQIFQNRNKDGNKHTEMAVRKIQTHQLHKSLNPALSMVGKEAQASQQQQVSWPGGRTEEQRAAFYAHISHQRMVQS